MTSKVEKPTLTALSWRLFLHPACGTKATLKCVCVASVHVSACHERGLLPYLHSFNANCVFPVVVLHDCSSVSDDWLDEVTVLFLTNLKETLLALIRNSIDCFARCRKCVQNDSCAGTHQHIKLGWENVTLLVFHLMAMRTHEVTMHCIILMNSDADPKYVCFFQQIPCRDIQTLAVSISAGATNPNH